MKDSEARDLIEKQRLALQQLRDDQARFQATVLEQVSAALTPVATQAAKASADAATVGAQIQHLQESFEVIALEGNEQRVDLNAVIETLEQQKNTLYLLIGNLKGVMDIFSVVPDDAEETPPPALNREARRTIQRQQRRA